MKKYLLVLLLCLGAGAANAQFAVSFNPKVGMNISPAFFKGFRTYYNEVNASSLDKKMGNPAFIYGHSINLGYRVMRLATSVGRDYLWARTSASFTSDAKRVIEYEYKITTVDLGYFHPGEGKEFTVEVGLVHCVANQYSYIKLPNGERDFFTGGVSANNNWTNLGMNLKFMYMKPISDNLLFHIAASGIYLSNENELAPRINLGAEEATLTLQGLSLGAGLTLKFGEYFD